MAWRCARLMIDIDEGWFPKRLSISIDAKPLPWITERLVNQSALGQLPDIPQHVSMPLSTNSNLKAGPNRLTPSALVVSSPSSILRSCQSVPLACSTAYMTHDLDIATLAAHHGIYNTLLRTRCSYHISVGEITVLRTVY